MYPEQLLQHISSGETAPLYAFVGENESRIDEAVKHITSTLASRGIAEMDRCFFDSRTHSPHEILQAARSVPFLSPKKLVVVQKAHVFNAAQWEIFNPYFAKPLDTCLFIFTLPVAAKDSKIKKLIHVIEQHGVVVFFEGPTEKNLKQYIQQQFKRNGKQVRPAALEALYRIVSLDARQVRSEIEKIVLYSGSRKTIEEEDLCVVSERFRSNVFNLVEAVGFGQLERSLQILDTLLFEGENPLGILKMVSRQFRMLIVARQYRGGRIPIAHITEQMGLNRNQEWLAKKAVQQAGGWSMRGLAEAFTVLFYTDCMLKTSVNKRLVMEEGLRRLAELRQEPSV